LAYLAAGAWVPGGGLKEQAHSEACVIDVAKGSVAGKVGAAGGAQGLAFSPDGARLAVSAGRLGGPGLGDAEVAQREVRPPTSLLAFQGRADALSSALALRRKTVAKEL
jgi:hypothetical protein